MCFRNLSVFLIIAILSSSCSNSTDCDVNQANNKMLALGRVQSRLVAKGGEDGMKFSAALATETGPIYELIAQQKYTEACVKADAIATKYGMDLAAEQKDMITYEQLAKDGGKGSGTCSMADASKKLMEIHGLLQVEVDAGRRSSDVFKDYNQDTVGFAEMLTRNPTEACDLLEKLRSKYKL